MYTHNCICVVYAYYLSSPGCHLLKPVSKQNQAALVFNIETTSNEVRENVARQMTVVGFVKCNREICVRVHVI